MAQIQYQRIARPVQFTADPAPGVPTLPLMQAPMYPRARAALNVTILAAACVFVPAVLTAAPTASGASQGGAGLVRRAQSVQYQALTGPVAIGDTLTTQQIAWTPVYPSQIPRKRFHPSQQRTVVDRIAFTAAAASTGVEWINQRPEPVRRTGQHPSRQSFIASPVGVGFGYVSWSYPDTIEPKRAIGRDKQATQYHTGPLFVSGVTQAVTPLSWAARYPERIHRKTHPASLQPSLVAPVFTPDVQEVVTPAAWEPQYPDSVLLPLRGLAVSAQQALAWYPITPAVDTGTAINQWAIFPDLIYGRPHPLSARQFELVAPLYLADVTTGEVAIDWLPTAPGQIARVLARPHLQPDAVWWPAEVVPELVASIYPDRLWAPARLVEYPSFAAPLFVPDVTESIPPIDGWIGSAEIPVRLVRTVPGLGWVYVDGGIAGVIGNEAEAAVQFHVDTQGRWFIVTEQGRFFRVRWV